MPSKTPNLQVAVGRAIRARRLDLNASQTEVAEAAGLHRSIISDAERGVRNLTLQTFLSIATALSVTPSFLVKKAEDAQKYYNEKSTRN